MTVRAPLLLGLLAEDAHVTWPGHPERPQRLDAVVEGIRASGLDEGVAPITGRPATHEELARVHDPSYLLALADLAEAGGGELDPDTSVAVGSWRTAVAAAGLGLAAVDALRAGHGEAAFVAPRPPGHHATARRGMGFCLLNNVAVTAAALAEQDERVLVLDWDVHHGNGTQDIFWDDPRVLYASLHESPAYPGTGAAHEVGGYRALGTTVNVPLPAGATGDVALAAFDEVVAPAIDAFAPTWVLVSAGFDAHRDDPLADLMWAAGDYSVLTRRLLAVAPGPGRTIAFLEGGYDLGSLARSVAATATALAGVATTSEPPTSGGPGRDAVVRAAEARRRAVVEREVAL